VHVGNDVAVGIHRTQAACGNGFLRGPQLLMQGFSDWVSALVQNWIFRRSKTSSLSDLETSIPE
jgi:hypothetical protein